MAVAEPTFTISSVYAPDGVISFFTTTPATVYRVRAYVYDADGVGVAAAQLSPLPSGDVLSWTANLSVSTFATAGETYTATLVAESQTDPDSGYCSRTFAVYDYPQVVLSPAASTTITGLPLAVTWAVTDVTGVSKQVLRVYGASNVVYATDYKPSLALDSSERSRVIGVADQLHPFVDGESYDVRIVVTNGVGLTTTVTHNVSVSWLPPVTPTATVTTDPDTLAASVTVTAGEATSATNVGEFFAHSLTDSSYWYSTSFSASMTAAGNGWAHLTYTNSGSDWAWVNVSPNAAAVSLTASTTYTYLIEVRNISGAIRVNAPATHSTASVWTGSKNTDFSADGIAHVTATTRADISSVTQVRTFLAVPANSSVTCDIRLSLYAGEYDGPYVPYDPPATDTLMVVRVSPDGTRHVLADDLESGDTVTDPLPPLGVAYTYEVTGIAATGVPSEPATVNHTAAARAWAFNFGANAEETLLIDGNPRVSWTLDQGGAAYHFADGGAGGGRPVWYGTTDRDEGGTISFATTGTATADRLRALCDAHGTGWIRDPFGRRWYAHMWPKFDYGGGNFWSVTISWDAVRFVEV